MAVVVNILPPGLQRGVKFFSIHIFFTHSHRCSQQSKGCIPLTGRQENVKFFYMPHKKENKKYQRIGNGY